ncbi:MAG: RluA family pseudouridine synthase [Chloroflexi bacterium]|nr:MAG: RluA family pseudouridine synthase [Chloroflexota bacterium]
MTKLELRADRDDERIDAFLARRVPDISRSDARRLIEEGRATVEGRQPKPSQRLRAGESVCLTNRPRSAARLRPIAMPLTILYQDADLLVIDKPAGLTVHPAPGHESGTLVNALLAIVPELGTTPGDMRPGIVHRLDKDTSGLMIVAKNERAKLAVQAQLKHRQVHKTYLALVHGIPEPREGVIEAPIGRHPQNRKKIAIIAGGRESVTKYRLREELGRYALLEVEPVTGRTHQIRVHMAATGHPVVGDPVYGRRSELVKRQFLHAWKLAFALPLGGRQVEFESPLPVDLRDPLERLRRGER